MTFTVDCPRCGAEVNSKNIVKRGCIKDDDEIDVTVARRQTAFDGSITSLHEMERFAHVVGMPCGCTIITVN